MLESYASLAGVGGHSHNFFTKGVGRVHDAVLGCGLEVLVPTLPTTSALTPTLILTLGFALRVSRRRVCSRSRVPWPSTSSAWALGFPAARVASAAGLLPMSDACLGLC